MADHDTPSEVQTADERAAAGCGRMLELFAAICGDPDNEDLAAGADQELAELDQLMAGRPV
jgi:hypothetical protein